MNKISKKREFDSSLNLKREVTVPAKEMDMLFYAHGEKTQANKISKSFDYRPVQKNKDFENGCEL